MNEVQNKSDLAPSTTQDQGLHQAQAAPFKPVNTNRWPLISIILALLLIGLAAVYYLQYSDLKSANADLTSSNKSLNSQLQESKKELSALQTKYNMSQTSNNSTPSATQADLDLSILSAQYVNPSGTVTSSGSWYGVRITLTNSTGAPISLNTSSFSLKDSSDNSYKVVGFTGATTLPDGWGANTIQDQTLASKAKVTGNLIFQLPNKTVNSFTLLNSTKSYTVKSTQ